MRYVLVLSMLAACGNSLRDDRFPTGSSTIAASRAHDAVYNVNFDEGTISRTDLVTQQVREIQVGSEPTRIARVGDDLWVTLKADASIAVIEDDGEKMRVAQVLPAGIEPHGIVATEDGRRVYVANTLSDQVSEYDGRTREKLRSFAVQDQPRFLALHPNEDVLYVASTVNGTLSWIDLESGEVSPIEVPETSRETTDGTVVLDWRPTGDISITPGGTTIAFPGVFADTETTVDEPEEDKPVTDGYGSTGSGIFVSRINAALVTFEVDGDGRPERDGTAILLASQPFAETEFEGRIPTFRSYPTSVTSSPSAREWLVTMESSNAVLVVSTDPPRSMGNDTDFTVVSDVGTSTDCEGCGGESMPLTHPEQGGFETRSTVVISTGVGPKGVVFDAEDQAVVHDWLDRAVESLPYEDAKDSLRSMDDGEGATETLFVARGYQQVAERSLPDDVEAGRRLFFSALDGRMAASGAGVSCSTCHMDGRNDGFTWTLKGEPRNTPSLAGPVFKTAPVSWSEEVPSVADEAMLTSEIRMGGEGLGRADAELIEAYVNATRYPDAPRADAELVQLGEEVFNREDVACASCHSGDLFTDNERHLILGGIATQTPTLRGIAASKPYLHDGSAPSLAAVVEMSRNGSMGDTSMLTDREREALVAFLESL